jgi:ABC-type branched-subunit amino acid transport system substrate-binding protein
MFSKTNSLINSTDCFTNIKPIGILGEYYSSISKPVSTLAGSYQLPVLSPASTSQDLSNKALFPYFSRTVAPDSQQANAIHDIILTLGWKQAAILYQDNDYARPFSVNLQAAAITALEYNKTSVAFTSIVSFPDGNLAGIQKALKTILSKSTYIIVLISLVNKIFLFAL